MVPLLRIRSSRRPGRTPTDQGRVVASSPAGRLACASLRQGLSEPRSGRWRTSSTSGPAPTTTCCCRRRRLRPAAAREGPTLVVACGWDTISYSSSIRHLASDNVFVIQVVFKNYFSGSQASGCCENEFLLINSSGAWLAARHKAGRGDQRLAALPPNFHAQANRPGAQAALPQHEVRDCGYESRGGGREVEEAQKEEVEELPRDHHLVALHGRLCALLHLARTPSSEL